MEYSEGKQSRANLPEPKKSDGLTIFVTIITTLVVFGAGIFGYSMYQNSQAQAHFVEVSITQAAEKVKNEENTIVVIGRTSCSHCQLYKPVAQKFAIDNRVKFYYIDLDEGTNSGDLEKHPEFAASGTPTTFYFHKGVSVKASPGELTAAQIQKDIDDAKASGFTAPKI